MSYTYNFPCSECEQVIPHTVNEHCEFAETNCSHCKAESFIVFGEAEQEILEDVFADQVFERDRQI
jgi:hypothetical protein